MTWGEIQIESLKKMFLNTENLKVEELETYRGDKKYKTYLFAMPQACNEAIKYITATLGTKVERFSLTKTSVNDIYDLSKLIPDYRKVKNIVATTTGISWKMRNDSLLEINDWYGGDIDVYYEIKPNIITSTTNVNKKIDISEEHAVIIPLYIAGELYKDDDLTMATMYMNEFMNMINIFSNTNNYIDNPRIENIYRIGD